MTYNYNTESIRKRKEVASRRTMMKKRVMVRLFKAFIVCLVISSIVAITSGFFFVESIVANTPSIHISDVLPTGEKSFVYANDGTTRIEELVAAGGNRIMVSLDEISPYLINAFIAIEDERFFEHDGVDLPSIARAFSVGISTGSFSEGASTITQQLIKNNIFPDFIHEYGFMESLERKLQEQYLALAIERQMSKYEILEAYLNTINLGQNTLGVEAASRRYFNKSSSDLTLSESAVIASITANPTWYDPLVHPYNNAYRRELVLNSMLRLEMITQEQHYYAMNDNVYERISYTIISAEPESPFSYFVDAVVQEVKNDLMERLGYTPIQAFNAVYTGGLRIITTQDLRIQNIAYEEINNDENYPTSIYFGLDFALSIHRENGDIEHYGREQIGEFITSRTGERFPLIFNTREYVYQAVSDFKSYLNIAEDDVINYRIDITPQPQASVVILDHTTGHVKAIVGGRGEKSTSLSFNRATYMVRQPGSAFKTLGVYPPALNSFGYTLATVLDDSPLRYYRHGDTPGDPTGPEVRNWDGVHRSDATVRFAIYHSMNVVAVRTLTDIGLETGYEYLQRFGFTTLVNFDDDNFPGFTDVSQATALGGITRGVTNLEMTAAHGAIANGGVYIRPVFYTKVLDSNGNILLDNTRPDYHRVIRECTAFLMTSAMEDVFVRGTGTTARLANGMPAAGKTGTTEWSTDLWLSAYTPYFTASVWGGFDTNRPMEGMNQTWHQVIWRNIMNRVHEDLEPRQFTIPTSVERLTICSSSGLLAGPNCRNRVTEYFSTSFAPTRTCNRNY